MTRLILGLAIAGLAAWAPATARDQLSFRKLEFQQPRDPLISNFNVYTTVHHTPAEQLDGARARLAQAIPAGTPRIAAERTLVAAGARCDHPSAAAESCRYSGLQTVDPYMDEVRWTVDLALADDRVSNMAVAREWQRHM